MQLTGAQQPHAFNQDRPPRFLSAAILCAAAKSEQDSPPSFHAKPCFSQQHTTLHFPISHAHNQPLHSRDSNSDAGSGPGARHAGAQAARARQGALNQRTSAGSGLVGGQNRAAAAARRPLFIRWSSRAATGRRGAPARRRRRRRIGQRCQRQTAHTHPKPLEKSRPFQPIGAIPLLLPRPMILKGENTHLGRGEEEAAVRGPALAVGSQVGRHHLPHLPRTRAGIHTRILKNK